jgi:hypothetical protein
MPEITREEMLNWLNNWYCQECAWPLVDEEDAYFAIRALLTAPEPKRVSVKMESIRWIFDRAVGEMGNGIGAGVIAAWLSDIGVEVTESEVVDGEAALAEVEK